MKLPKLVLALLCLASPVDVAAQMQIHQTGILSQVSAPPQEYVIIFYPGSFTVSTAGPKKAALEAAISGTGPFTFTAPAGLKSVAYSAQGGGAGGTGGYASLYGEGGGGGGSGALAVYTHGDLAKGKTCTFTAGAGGYAGWQNSVAGGAGGNTTATCDTVTITANGSTSWMGANFSGPTGVSGISGGNGGSKGSYGSVGANGDGSSLSFKGSTYYTSGGGGGNGCGTTCGEFGGKYGQFPNGWGGMGGGCNAGAGNGLRGGGGGGGACQTGATAGSGGAGFVYFWVTL